MGRGVLVIALAVDSFPFSCFKMRCTELQRVFPSYFNDIALIDFKHAKKKLIPKEAMSSAES